MPIEITDAEWVVREYYLDILGPSDASWLSFKKEANNEHILAIATKAWDKATWKAQAELESLRSELARVSGERDKAVEVLRVYAEPDSWCRSGSSTLQDLWVECGVNGYDLAQKTLREIEQPPTDKERRE